MNNGVKSIEINSDWLYHRVTAINIDKWLY